MDQWRCYVGDICDFHAVKFQSANFRCGRIIFGIRNARSRCMFSRPMFKLAFWSHSSYGWISGKNRKKNKRHFVKCESTQFLLSRGIHCLLVMFVCEKCDGSSKKCTIICTAVKTLARSEFHYFMFAIVFEMYIVRMNRENENFIQKSFKQSTL